MARLDPEPFQLEIDDLTLEGQGVGRRAGKACFVAGALPGETVRAVLTARKHNFDQARLEEILTPAPDRITPPCPYFGVCGGCRLMHLQPEAQRRFKEKALFDALARIGQCAPEQRLPALVGSDLGYRRTARLGVKYVPRKGCTLVGFHERAGRYLADMQACLVLHPALGQRIASLRQLLDTMAGRQSIPQIEGAVDDAGHCALVFRHLQPLSADDQARLRAYANQEQVQIHLQPGGPDSVAFFAGPRDQLLYRHPEFGVSVPFSPLDFVQVHGEINRQMVSQAIALLELEPQHRVLDLFCGLGNFTLPLATRTQQVVGVEGSAIMLERASANARAQGYAHITYHRADLDSEALAQADWWRNDFDRILLDPPRTGAAAVVATLIERAPVSRLLYISCNPATLARDAAQLTQTGRYRLQAAGIMDMFPHTAHAEAMALFVPR